MYRPQFNIRFLPRNLVLATLMAAIFLISACGGDIETLSGKGESGCRISGSPDYRGQRCWKRDHGKSPLDEPYTYS
ncbi:MAG: hypothetical protein CM1200mP22_22000 [Dehalococcoidia bacterium]|nr:MAG: hypothetical protein CM1200mP22_22000 [Dehalococcoidia bacterium]